MKKTPKPRVKIPSLLTGRTGVALVEFQLGRRGFEFMQTPFHSKSGDLWTEAEVGRISIEVKTTDKGRSWFVKSNQTTSEIFCLVNLEDAMCYVLTRDEMAIAISKSSAAYPGIYCVKEKSLPPDALEGWSRVGSRRMRAVFAERRRPSYKSTRRVTRVMADGSSRTYEYPPSNQNEKTSAQKTEMTINDKCANSEHPALIINEKI